MDGSGQFRLTLRRVLVPREQERGCQDEEAGGRDRGARADGAGQHAPESGQGRDSRVAADRPRGQGAGGSVFLGVVEPVSSEHRVEHAHAGDQAELNGDDEHDPGGAGPDEGQPGQPARAQRAGGAHDLVLPEPRNEPAG
jgi:hypothetical protein